jgi:signal transduction histidine kinase
MKKNFLSRHFQSIDNRIDPILSFPGISNKELQLRKNYWYGTIVCGMATLLLSLFVLMLTTVPKVLVVYGILVISGQLLTASVFLLKPHNIIWVMIIHLYWVMLVTFVFIVRLGGIPYSGGLVFIGFGLAFFALPMHSVWRSIELIGVYLPGVIITTVLQPFLPYPPIISERVNFVLFAANISWLSITILVYLLRSIKQNIETEHVETIRLKEPDEVKTRLFTHITHEFRTPLTIILGMAKLVKEKPGEWLEPATENIRNSGQNLLNLVNYL